MSKSSLSPGRGNGSAGPQGPIGPQGPQGVAGPTDLSKHISVHLFGYGLPSQ
jgi:hypothetical protein